MILTGERAKVQTPLLPSPLYSGEGAGVRVLLGPGKTIRMPHMLEIEQKFAHADFAAIQRRLADWGVTAHDEHVEADHYFNAPDRDFAKTDEAFRLRRIGEQNFLTYKGPKQAAAVKIRTELEIPLRDGDEAAAQMTQLLRHLGYRPVAVVKRSVAPGGCFRFSAALFS